MRDLRNEKPTGNGADEKESLMPDEVDGNEALEPPSVDFGTSASAAVIDLLSADLNSAITEEIAVNRRGETELLNSIVPERVKVTTSVPVVLGAVGTGKSCQIEALRTGWSYRQLAGQFLVTQNQESIDLKGQEIATCIRDSVEEIDFFTISEDELTQKFEELQQLLTDNIGILQRHSEYKTHVENDVIEPLKYSIDNILFRLSCSGKLFELTDGDVVSKLKFYVNALYYRYHFGHRAAGRTINGHRINGSDTTPKAAAPNIVLAPAKKILTPDQKRKIKELGRLAEEGKIREAMNLSREICDTYENYQRLYTEGKHNFMKPVDEPDEVMRFVLSQIQNKKEFHEFNEKLLRFLELGIGFGGDAKNWVENFPNAIGYHAIDAYEPAVHIARSRLDELKISGKTHKDFGHNIFQGDYVKYLINDKEFYPDYGWNVEDERVILYIKNAGHYYFEPFNRHIIVPNLFRVVWTGRGLLIYSTKTPESATFFEHELVYEKGREKEQGGYHIGFHPVEGQVRAFITQNKLVSMLEEGGFDIVPKDERGNAIKDKNGRYPEDENGLILISENAVVQRIEMPNYDRDGQIEVVTTVMARPKRIKEHI